MKNTTTSINLDENGVYIVKDGQLEKMDPPPTGYGRQTIIWQNDIPIRIESTYSKQLNE